MRSSVDISRCQLLIEGYLDVKAPPDSPERILYKAWRRMWVSATAILPSGRGEPHLILVVSRHPTEDSNPKQVKASRDGLRLFRCSSGSRPLRTWALASGSTLLVYLAAETERETQGWMKAIRDGMWPPIILSSSLTGTSYEVSLIDDEKSFTSGLLGVYGRLVQTSEDVISIIHPHWQGTQMRWHLCDILDVRLIRTVGKDNVAGVFHLSFRSTSKDKRTLLFYSNTAKIVIEWIRSLLQTTKNSPKAIKSKADIVELPHPSEKTNCTSDIASEYAVVQNSRRNEKLETISQTSNPDSDDTHGDTKLTKNKLKVPNSFLNASITSTTFRNTEANDSSNPDGSKTNDGSGESEEESDDSFAGMYEHLYDDLVTRKDSRSYTVYEEVNDEEDEEYVPPMPPSLPKRQLVQQLPILASQEPAALRLQKLCESVTEALKQVEETPIVVEHAHQKDNSQKRKKKDGQTSTKHESSRSPKLEAGSSEGCDIERVFSDSDTKEASIKECDLPLLPFNYRADSDKKEQRLKEKPSHQPLQDILKSLKVDSVKAVIEKSGNSLLSEVTQTDSLNAKKSASQSEEIEAQYLEMS